MIKLDKNDQPQMLEKEYKRMYLNIPGYRESFNIGDFVVTSGCTDNVGIMGVVLEVDSRLGYLTIAAVGQREVRSCHTAACTKLDIGTLRAVVVALKENRLSIEPEEEQDGNQD